MKDNCLCFEDLACPYCGNAPGWFFEISELGDRVIRCYACDKPFVAIISVSPKVEAIYKIDGVD